MLKTRWGFTLTLIASVIIGWLFAYEFIDPTPACAPFVEVALAESESSYLSCVEDLPLDCRSAVKGDLVRVEGALCRIEAQGMGAKSRLLLGMPLLLNRVSQSDLMLLDGVGEKTAAAIVALREKLGGFGSVEQLLEVEGIGQKRFDGFRKQLTVSKLPENRAKVLDSSTDGD